MIYLLKITWHVIHEPHSFFESTRQQGWWEPYRLFLIIALVLSIFSPLAWALGIDGNSPVNTSLTAQRDVYRWWHDMLFPKFGVWSIFMAMAGLLLEMHIILIFFTPVLHFVFRGLGGQGPAVHAWKALCYGLAPTMLFGFLPGIALALGVYATLLQLCVGPSILYRVHEARAYMLLVIVLSIAIAAFWHGLAI